ncbi:MAG: hypothetical protein Nk1A_8570 [Endomicrobiia bacterium]|nr:MAG: hypothetical protein Nk1A_8570 [Endomicrobiia bacterium]
MDNVYDIIENNEVYNAVVTWNSNNSTKISNIEQYNFGLYTTGDWKGYEIKADEITKKLLALTNDKVKVQYRAGLLLSMDTN